MALSEDTQVQRDTREWGAFQVLEGEKDDETVSSAIDIRNVSDLTLFVETNGTVSGGVVKLETSMTEAGPYFVAGSVTTAAGSTGYADTLAAGDAGLPARYARARIETAISGGGTVDVFLVTQK